MHIVDEKDAKRIMKEKSITQVDDLYRMREEVEQEYGYLFKEGVGITAQTLHTVSYQVCGIIQDGGVRDSEGEVEGYSRRINSTEEGEKR